MIPDPSLISLIAIVLAATIFLITIINTDAAMVFLLFSMLLSPEIELAGGPGHAVVVRIDDLLLVVIFFTWLAKMAINKQMGIIRQTPLNAPLGLLIAICLGSTMWGMIDGTVEKPIVGFFYVLKYIEYLVLYFLVANVIRDEKQIHFYLRIIFITAAIVGVCCYVQMVQFGEWYRVSAPFEGKPEPNTLAGYLLVIIFLAAGLAVHVRSASRRIALLGLIGFLLPPFLYTYSRGGYVSFIGGFILFCFLSKRHKGFLFFALLIGAFIARFYLPATIYQRVADTFDPRSSYEIGGVKLATSPAARFDIWKYGMQKLFERPLFGFGVTGIGFVDSQYVLILGELGMVGMAVFIWLWWRIWRISFKAFHLVTDPLGEGLTLGFMAGFASLLVLSFTGNIFVIVRIMEPFWFIAAMVLMLPKVMAIEGESVPVHPPVSRPVLGAARA